MNKCLLVGGGVGRCCFDVIGLGGGCFVCYVFVGWEEDVLGCDF